MSSPNLWDLYTLDDLDDDQVHEDYIIDYEIEDDWPEYEIPEDDIVLNKEALLAIRLAQPLNRNDKQQKQQQVVEGDEFLKEAQSDKEDEEEEKAESKNNLISSNSNIRLNKAIQKEEEEKIDAMHQMNKGSSAITITTTTVDDEEILPPQAASALAKESQTIGQTVPDDTMTILLISCLIIWLIFQFKNWWKINSSTATCTEKMSELPYYHNQKEEED